MARGEAGMSLVYIGSNTYVEFMPEGELYNTIDAEMKKRRLPIPEIDESGYELSEDA
jgi:hypothetical protein